MKISSKEARQTLGNQSLSDDEIIDIIENVYDIAEEIVEQLLEEAKSTDLEIDQIINIIRELIFDQII